MAKEIKANFPLASKQFEKVYVPNMLVWCYIWLKCAAFIQA